MNYSGLLTKMLMFVILISTGFIFARKNILTVEFNKCTSKLILNLFLPCAIVNSVISGRPEMSSKELWSVMALLTLSFVICYAVGFAYTLIAKKDKNARVTELLLSATNTFFVGMPILAAAIGGATSFYVGISCISFNLILYSYGVWRINGGKGSIALKDMITTCLVASLAAMIIFIFNLELPAFATEIIGTISNATVPISMVIIGSTMGQCNPLEELKKPRTWIFLVLKLIIIPLIVYFALRPLTPDDVVLATCVILCGCPSAVLVTAFCLQYNKDAEYSSKMIATSTLLSLITLPLFLIILF